LSAEADSAFRVPCTLIVQRATAAGNHIYRESEVNDKAELVLVNHRGPAYPNEKTEAIPATVLVEVVVDSTGAADVTTFRPVQTGPEEFLISVREFLSTATYTPARVAGHPVAECLMQTFQFVPTYYHRAGGH
jgi:protein TonB